MADKENMNVNEGLGNFADDEALKEIDFTDNILYLRFDCNEECKIYNPKEFYTVNERLEIKDAENITWSFYPYGKPQTQRCLTSYDKENDSTIHIIDQYSNKDITISAKGKIAFACTGSGAKVISELLSNGEKVSRSGSQINYIKEKALTLLSTESSSNSLAATLGDYLTEDIANDWIREDTGLLEEMQSLGIISCKVTELYNEIMQNFESVSNGQPMFDASVWTLDSLVSHPFWIKQRTLAKELIGELNLANKFNFDLKEKIIHGFDVHEQLINNGVEFHVLEEKRYLTFWNEPIKKDNIEKVLDITKEKINKFLNDRWKTIIVVGYTDEVFKKRDLCYFDSVNTFVVFYLIDKENKRIFKDDSWIYIAGCNYGKFVRKIDKIVRQELEL